MESSPSRKKKKTKRWHPEHLIRNMSPSYVTTNTVESHIELMRPEEDARWLFFSPLFLFFYRGALITGGQIAVISDTDNHVALSRYPQTFPCPRLCLAASSSLPLPLQLSQAKGCSCRCHMMSCGPLVVAEQWQFYPCAIRSTRHPLVTCAHAACSSVCVWAS